MTGPLNSQSQVGDGVMGPPLFLLNEAPFGKDRPPSSSGVCPLGFNG